MEKQAAKELQNRRLRCGIEQRAVFDLIHFARHATHTTLHEFDQDGRIPMMQKC